MSHSCVFVVRDFRVDNLFVFVDNVLLESGSEFFEFGSFFVRERLLGKVVLVGGKFPQSKVVLGIVRSSESRLFPKKKN